MGAAGGGIHFMVKSLFISCNGGIAAQISFGMLGRYLRTWPRDGSRMLHFLFTTTIADCFHLDLHLVCHLEEEEARQPSRLHLPGG